MTYRLGAPRRAATHRRSHLRAFGLGLAAILGLSACQTLPYANDRTVPPVVEVADASPEREALNARTYDAAVRWVSRRFYKRDFGGMDWAQETATRRAEAVAQPDETSFYRTLNATLDLLNDPHTTAVTPTRYRERLRDRREARPVIGFGMRVVDDQYIVTEVRADAPAAGKIERGWRLESIDCKPVSEGFSSRSQPEHELIFTDANDQSRTVILPEVDLPPHLGDMERRADGVVVLSFDYFAPTTRDWFLDRMRELVADPPPGLIIDLRDNRGGLLRAVGATLSPFFTERQPYAYVEYGYLPRLPDRTRPWRRGYDGPVAVLISGASASGAEVFAATMQETGRGRLFGTKTRGAVVASRDIVLPDGGELGIGVRAFRSGQGAVLEGVGVAPDHEVDLNLADLRRGVDPVVEAAATALLAQDASVASVADDPDPS